MAISTNQVFDSSLTEKFGNRRYIKMPVSMNSQGALGVKWNSLGALILYKASEAVRPLTNKLN
jgi:hypothetical protein